jgi:hypothetical protein
MANYGTGEVRSWPEAAGPLSGVRAEEAIAGMDGVTRFDPQNERLKTNYTLFALAARFAIS